MLTKNHKVYDFPNAIDRVQSLNIKEFQNRLKKSGLELTDLELISIKNQLIDDLNFLYKLNENIKINPNLKMVFKKEDQPEDIKFKEIIGKTEFLSGNEYTIDVLCDLKGEILSIVPRKRLQIKAGISSKGKIIIQKLISGEKVDPEQSGLSKREWNELMTALELNDKLI